MHHNYRTRRKKPAEAQTADCQQTDYSLHIFTGYFLSGYGERMLPFHRLSCINLFYIMMMYSYRSLYSAFKKESISA